MSAFADLVRFVPTAGGTTDWVFSTAVGGCQSPALAGVQNGVSYKVYAVSADLTQWEISTGVYSSGVLTFPRTTVLYNSSGTGTATGQSGAGTKISFSTVPQVSVVALAEDMTVTTAAAKSDQVAGTSATLAVTPAHQQDHLSAAKAWVLYTAATGVILDSYNVASVTRTNAGQHVVTFITPFASANYAIQVNGQGGNLSGSAVNVPAPTASAFTASYVSSAGTATDPTIGHVVCYGRQ